MKKTEQPKEKQLLIRLSADDKRTIKAKAKRAGLNLSDYMRRAALRQKIEERLPADFRKQLVVAGTNLSRLTHLAQAGKLASMDTQELNVLLQTLLKSLQ